MDSRISGVPETIRYDLDLDSDYGIDGFNRQTQEIRDAEVTGYRNYGPRAFYFNQLEDAEDDAFGTSSQRNTAGRSWFAERARAHAVAKARYLFGSGAPPTMPDAFWNSSFSRYRARTDAGDAPTILMIYLEFEPVRVTGQGRVASGQRPTLLDWGFFRTGPTCWSG